MLSPAEVYRTFWRHRGLIAQMASREIVGRYKGSYLGLAWSLLLPLLMLGVYTFIFSVVFESRWGTTSGGRFEFALLLFCGLIAYNIFSESILRAPNLILNNTIYVKKVVFPLEILPWISVLTALFTAAVSVVVLLLFYSLIWGIPHWTILLFPVVLLPLVLSVVGVSWFLASFGVFVRDVGHLIGVLVSLLLFMSPVFYPVSAVPRSFQVALAFNPLTFVIEQSREVLIWGRLPRWDLFFIYLAGSFIVAWLGLIWFQKTKKGFADVV